MGVLRACRTWGLCSLHKGTIPNHTFAGVTCQNRKWLNMSCSVFVIWSLLFSLLRQAKHMQIPELEISITTLCTWLLTFNNYVHVVCKISVFEGYAKRFLATLVGWVNATMLRLAWNNSLYCDTKVFDNGIIYTKMLLIKDALTFAFSETARRRLGCYILRWELHYKIPLSNALSTLYQLSIQRTSWH